MTKKRKILIFSLIFLLLLLVLGVYVFLDYLNYKEEIEESQWETPRFMEYESVENFVVKDTAEGKMVINENAGLSFMVPEGWNVEKVDEGDNKKKIKISTFDKEKKDKSLFLAKGCVIEVFVEHYAEVFPDEEHRPRFILKQIKGEKEMTVKDAQEVINIGNYPALKTVLYKGRKSGEVIMIEVPIKERELYTFSSAISSEEEERCSEKFSNFLESISIDI